MKRAILSLCSITLMAAVFCGGFQLWRATRSVDGRNTAEWLKLADATSRSASYRAEGRTTANGHELTFTLEQGEGGRYSMLVNGTGGRECYLGKDGDQIWNRTGKQLTRAFPSGRPENPLRVTRRISGIGSTAGRKTVLLQVESGPVLRSLAIDRQTGIVLATSTSFQGKELNRMVIDRISFQAVSTPPCAGLYGARCLGRDGPEVSEALPGEIEQLLKRAALVPRQLPKGFALRRTFLQWCDACLQEMAALRFSDGQRSFTLFEIPSPVTFDIKKGCVLLRDGTDLVESRKLGETTIVAVGNLERTVLTDALTSLM